MPGASALRARPLHTLLILLLSAALTLSSGIPALAQEPLPPVTQELFAPFWEAWELLHANYVDPLDDAALIVGATEGLIRAAALPPDTITVAPIPQDATDDQTRLTPFWQAWQDIHRVKPLVDDDVLLDGALHGLMAAVGDPHTDYMDPETYARVSEGMSGEYEGIGATVRTSQEYGGLELVTIMEGSPAQAAGLQAGDVIVEVDGEDVTGLSQNEIISRVRGPANTTVHLGIRRPGVAEILYFDVVRQRIHVPSVVSRLLSDRQIGYLRLNGFEDDTTAEMVAALKEMNANALRGLILDMRGNPGGYLTTAIQVASAFLREGNILIERSPDRTTEYPRVGEPVAPDVPMVVLVDQGSASASELVAGALQDHHRAIVVGMPTFGKGSVQRWYRLSNGGGIRITVSRWYTPNGRSVSEKGIQPDVQVAYEPNPADNTADNQLEVALQVLQGTYVASEQAANPTPAFSAP
jgi:carboxyl-terminal processing protease